MYQCLPPALQAVAHLADAAIQPQGLTLCVVPLTGRLQDEDAWTWRLLRVICDAWNEPKKEA